MDKSTQNWFNEWSNEYDKTLGKLQRHHDMLDLAVKMSEVKNGENVLDIGCGTGLLSLKFLKAAKCSIFGIDLSEEMLAHWKKKIATFQLSEKVQVATGDASNLQFDDSSFDIVASTVTLHHVKNKQKTIDDIHRILKPGGRLVIGDLDVDTSGDLNDIKRLRHILDYLKEECTLALQDGGVGAFSRMYDNGKKHILNDGEYCVDFDTWSELCKNAGFEDVTVVPVDSFSWMKVLRAQKALP